MQKRDLYYERIPTKLLRENVRYLGNILGKVLKDQEGDKFFELVEKIRKLSKVNKTNINSRHSYRKIIRTIKGLNSKKFCPSCSLITFPKIFPRYLTFSLKNLVGILS